MSVIGPLVWFLLGAASALAVGPNLITSRLEDLQAALAELIDPFLPILEPFCSIAGAAGCLYTYYVKIVDPDVFLFIYTVTMVIMVITGGKGTLAGPVVGGIIFGILPEVLREFARPEVQWIIYGGIMILIVFFLPDGIVPALQSWWKRKFTPASKTVGSGGALAEGPGGGTGP